MAEATQSPATSLIAAGVATGSSWQLAAEAIDRAAQLMADVPGFYGYELAPESDLDLRAATVLVQRAVWYLRAAAAREAPRLEAVEARFRSRDESPPWEREPCGVTEDGD